VEVAAQLRYAILTAAELAANRAKLSMGPELRPSATISEPCPTRSNLDSPLVTADSRIAPAQTPRWDRRWSICLAAAVFFHATAAAALFSRWNEFPDQVANTPIITVELAALPVAPDVAPSDAPPGPPQTAAKPEPQQDKPIETVELSRGPQPQPSTPLPPTPAERQESQPQTSHARLASAPTTVERHAPRAAAPGPGAPTHDANAMPDWKSRLLATLERNKRYPVEAEARGEHGIASLAFSVDRRGRVHHARIARSSGSSLLDRATLAMLERSVPLPPPPPEVAGAEIPVVVPIRYTSR